MGDVEHLCSRVVLIDRGALRYDGPLSALATRLAPWKLIRVATATGANPDWSTYGEVVGMAGERVEIRVERDAAPAATARLLADLDIVDLSVEDPPIESVIDLMYREHES
jgi:ABC-2 type transport system ATP-binding protein